MEDKKTRHLSKPALLLVAGFVVVALILGLFAYESVKGGVSMTKGTEAAAADRLAVAPPIDVAGPERFETATFALG